MDWLARGLPVEGARANAARLGAVCRRDVPTCGLEEPVSDVAARTWRAGWDLCVVVNEKRVVLGILLSAELKLKGHAKDVMSVPRTHRPGVETKEVIEQFAEKDWHRILVTTPDGELVGVAYREDIIKAAA